MVEILPQENGLFRIAGIADVSGTDIQHECQARLDIVRQVVDLIGDDEVELDMTDKVTASVLENMAKSVVDHYMICDFDMSSSIAEVVLELDPEDHYGVMSPLVYSYAMISDGESVEQLLPFVDCSQEEKELMTAILKFQKGEKAILSPNLTALLLDAESDLSRRTEHLWLVIPKFKELLKI